MELAGIIYKPNICFFLILQFEYMKSRSKERSKSFFDNIELGVPKCSSLPTLSSGKQFIR